MSHLVSIIMAAYNTEKYIGDAINSVIGQSWNHWELLIINDGSTDKTKEIIRTYCDPRVRYFEQLNSGVSSARNVGLVNMRGGYFCFLDADDILPPDSLCNRLDLFKKDNKIRFVDGVVEKKDMFMQNTLSWFYPNFSGDNPLQELAKLSEKCFFGLSWMIRRNQDEENYFKEGLSHSEDLLFYLRLARKGGFYTYSKQTVYIYRNSPVSAMKNLKGLEQGYMQVFNEIKKWPEIRRMSLLLYRLKVKKIMFLSYMRLHNDFKESLRSLFRN